MLNNYKMLHFISFSNVTFSAQMAPCTVAGSRQEKTGIKHLMTFTKTNYGANCPVKYTIGLLAVYTAEPVSNKSLACGSYFKVKCVLFKT